MRIKDIKESYYLNSWKKHTNQENKYIRECYYSENDTRVEPLDSFIYLLDNGYWMCEYAATFSEDFEKRIFIPSIKKFSRIEEAVIWIDTELSEIPYYEVKDPLIFYWY